MSLEQKPFKEAAEALLKAFAELNSRNSDSKYYSELLSGLNKTIFNDIQSAKDLLARLQYWLSVLVAVRDAGNAWLSGVIYRNLEQIFAATGLRDYLPDDDQVWLQHLSIQYPRSDLQTDFVMDGYEPLPEIDHDVPKFNPSESCLKQIKELKDTAMRARAEQERQAERREWNSEHVSPVSNVSSEYLGSIGPDSTRPRFTAYEAIMKASIALQRQEALIAKDAQVEFQVECFKGIFTALRAEKPRFFGNFLNNLNSTHSYASQLHTIKTHVAQADKRMRFGQSLSLTAWTTTLKKTSTELPPGKLEELEAKVKAYQCIYGALRMGVFGRSNFAANIRDLSLLAQWAAIEQHVLSDPDSRSAKAWGWAEEAMQKGLSFEAEKNAKSKLALLSKDAIAWLANKLDSSSTNAPNKTHERGISGVGPALSVKNNQLKTFIVTIKNGMTFTAK